MRNLEYNIEGGIGHEDGTLGAETVSDLLVVVYHYLLEDPALEYVYVGLHLSDIDDIVVGVEIDRKSVV